MFDLMFILGVLVITLTCVMIFMVLLGIILMKYFPKSNLTKWFRGNVITDEDLEP